MKDGKILQYAPPRVIYADPDHLDVAEFIGTPKINVIPADVDQAGWLTIGGTELLSGFDAWRGQVLRVGIRPDHAELIVAGDVSGRHFRLPFEVSRVEFLGGQATAHGIVPSGGEIRVRIAPDFTDAQPGRTLTLIVPAAHLLVFAPDGARIRHPATVAAVETMGDSVGALADA
jgi:multiple sugar transport system ATP-binding protein